MPDNDPHPRAQTSSCDPMSASASASVYFTSPLSASLADASSVVVTATCSSEHWTDSLPVLCPADSHSSQFMWIPTLCCCSRHSRSPPSSSSSSQHLPSELHLSKELAALWRPPSHTSHFLTPTSRHIIRFNNRTSSAFHYAPVFHGPLTDIEYPALLFTAFVVDLEREVSLSADEVLRLPRGEVPRMVWRRCRMRASDSIQKRIPFDYSEPVSASDNDNNDDDDPLSCNFSVQTEHDKDTDTDKTSPIPHPPASLPLPDFNFIYPVLNCDTLPPSLMRSIQTQQEQQQQQKQQKHGHLTLAFREMLERFKSALLICVCVRRRAKHRLSFPLVSDLPQRLSAFQNAVDELASDNDLFADTTNLIVSTPNATARARL